MKQLNPTSNHTHIARKYCHIGPKLSIRAMRQNGRHWHRFISSILLVSILLFGPIGTLRVHALAAPILIGPANGSTTTSVNFPPVGVPEFSWNFVSGSKKYEIQVSNNIGFTTTNLTAQTANTSYTPIDNTNFPDGLLYWRVRVIDPTPISDWSTIWSFNKQWATTANRPSLSEPLSGATIDFYDFPKFSWTAVPGAAQYRFQIYTSPGGWASANPSIDTITTTYQPAAKLTNGTYYWSVVPLDSRMRLGTRSYERVFIAGYNLVPTLLSPESEAEPTFTPTFSWTAVRGAQYYDLQYSTDSNFTINVHDVKPRGTSYTPVDALPNDTNFYWRVRAYSGSSISNWSPSRRFTKKWNIKPELLTPTNNYQHERIPLYNWTPVPGASYYKIDIDNDINFGSIYDTQTTSNTFFTPVKYLIGDQTWYWRVTPYDGAGNPGQVSDTFSYRSYADTLTPYQVYPLYYYPPNSFVDHADVSVNPYEDRTVPLPIFMWHRVLAYTGEAYAEAYRLQVSSDATFMSVDWSVDTENTVATPSASNPFTPLAGTNYYWQVVPLIGGSPAGNWSQTWVTQIDLSRGATPTAGPAPTLIRPVNGFEIAETTPLLEWFPVSGATSYDVEISPDESFGSTVDTATVDYPAYAPTQSLAQRNLGDVNFGVYYWRVRVSGGTWSEIRRYQIAAQSHWRETRTTGDAFNRLQIGSDPGGDVVDSDYDLTDLQAAQARDYWYFGFNVPTSPTKDVVYALYLDLDHQASSGASYDARGFTLTTVPAYRPEYAVYIYPASGSFTADRVFIYHWKGSAWDALVARLDSIGGSLNKSGTYVELKIPGTAIGQQDSTGSYTATFVSLPTGTGGLPQDSVPSDPNIPGGSQISRFSSVTERANVIMPANNAGVDPITYPTLQPTFWDWPIDSVYYGYFAKLYLDPEYTSGAGSMEFDDNGDEFWVPYEQAWPSDLAGDNTYYWRIQSDYVVGPTDIRGAWSQGSRFERKGFIPQNLQISADNATPTFSWDMVEGAAFYELEVDTDPYFNSSSKPVDIDTDMNTFTVPINMKDATYYWRVRAVRFGSSNIPNQWTTPAVPCPENPDEWQGCFRLQMPAPTGLYTEPAGVVGRTPTLCWTPVVVNGLSGYPIFAAYRYYVQINTDPEFSKDNEVFTTDQSCVTSTNGYVDGSWYWHVAVVLDGSNIQSSYSATSMLTKQYPITALLSPLSGESMFTTPTFVWMPVDGASKYKLQVSKQANFSVIYEEVETENTRYTPLKTYDPNTIYYWRVAIKDYDSKFGPYNTAIIILSPYPNHIYMPLIKKR